MELRCIGKRPFSSDVRRMLDLLLMPALMVMVMVDALLNPKDLLFHWGVDVIIELGFRIVDEDACCGISICEPDNQMRRYK